MKHLQNTLRMALGLTLLGVVAAFFGLVCVVLLPSRRLRIAACNVFGHIMGPTLMWVSGTHVSPDVQAKLKAVHPAIYVSNHTSIIDMFVAIWACPLFTCGVAKKEIIYYPFIGQLYLISGHLRVDRGNRASAAAGMARLTELVHRNKLGIWIWAEGTRSRDGQLLPLKKGFAHLALATRLPIVPVVVKGAHKGWTKNQVLFQQSNVEVEVLPPISTTHWTAENMDAQIVDVHARFRAALPDDQKGLPMVLAAPEAPAPRLNGVSVAAAP